MTLSLIALAVWLLALSAPSERILYHFTGPANGGYALPDSTLVRDPSGTLYGTADEGTQGNCHLGCGEAYALVRLRDGGYQPMAIHAFSGFPDDGASPSGTLVEAADGTLFGDTISGGPEDLGLVYKLTPASSGYVETILYAFTGKNDGAFPSNGLTLDPATGELYGSTSGSGSGSQAAGNIFKLTPHGSGYAFSVVHTFIAPNGGPTQQFFATIGGLFAGWADSIVRVAPAPSGDQFTVVYSFGPSSNGIGVSGPLVADDTGNLYGVTQYGGGRHCRRNACGTAFELIPASSGYTENVLHVFDSAGDGRLPVDGLAMDSDGALYGATMLGGKHEKGTIFKLTPSRRTYVESVLHSFPGDSQNGKYPQAGLTLDPRGRIYGTTYRGGGPGCPFAYPGCGIVFELRD